VLLPNEYSSIGVAFMFVAASAAGEAWILQQSMDVFWLTVADRQQKIHAMQADSEL
jgi:hypothetical protein